MEKTIIEQRAAIHFFWKVGFNATKTFEVVQKVYGESAVHRAIVFHSWFVMNREVEDQQQQERAETLLV